MMTKQKKVTVTYYYDALCGWCFGMYPAISELHQKYKQRVDFEVISGGLFLNERAGKVNIAAPHIKQGAYKQVEERTGVKFGESFLSDLFGKGENTLDSRLPAIALCIVKAYFPSQAMLFASSLTRAIYEDGIDSSDINAYTKYATNIGFEAKVFQEKMSDKRYEILAQEDFKTYLNSGIRGFPTLVIKSGKGSSVLAQGHSSLLEMELQLNEHLALN